MLSPHAEKWGGRVPPRPPPIDACGLSKHVLERNTKPLTFFTLVSNEIE